MNFVRLALQHTGQTLRKHVWLLVLLAGAHLVANAAFTAFASMAYEVLFFGSRIQPEPVGWMANAPLTASLAVIITSVTFGTARATRIINKRFLGAWLPLTFIYAWSYYFAWYCQTIFPVNMTAFVTKHPGLTEYFPLSFFNQTLPWLCALFVASLATLSVPIFVARRQAFWRHHAALAPLVVVAISAAFMLARDHYRLLTGDINPYHWLPFPGYNPAGIAYDRIVYALIELPFLIPTSVFVTCLTASLLVAVDLDKRSMAKA